MWEVISKVAVGCVVFFGFCIAWGLLRLLWMRISWHVIGLRPIMLDHRILARTVHECSEGAWRSHTDAHQIDETSPSYQFQKDCFIGFSQLYTRFAIERYIRNLLLVKGSYLLEDPLPPPTGNEPRSPMLPAVDAFVVGEPHEPESGNGETPPARAGAGPSGGR